MRQLLSIFDLMTIIVIILIKLPAVCCAPLTHSHSPLPSYRSPCLPPLIVFLFSFGLANALLFATFVSRLKNKKEKKRRNLTKTVGYLCVFVAHEFPRACLTRDCRPAFHIRLVDGGGRVGGV